MKNRVFISAISLIVILGVAAVTIFFARGYTFNRQGKIVQKTGILAISSLPDAASVYLDNRLTSATDTTISFLAPGQYTVKIQKEGYAPWEKTITIKEELVTKILALLFPLAPELKPLTYSGVHNPLVSPDGQKIVYTVPSGEKSGLWVLDITNGKPLPTSPQPEQVVKDTPSLFFSQGKYFWAPDSKNLFITLQEEQKPGNAFTRNYVLDTEKFNEKPLDITVNLTKTLNDWQADLNLKEEERTKRMPLHAQKIALEASGSAIASSSAEVKLNYFPSKLHWSPQETKFFWEEKNKYIVYDLKEKIKSEITKAKFALWYPASPDANHLILVENNQISMIEADGMNKTSVFAGNFDPNFVIPWPSGGKIVILTNFNSPNNADPNLYTVNLR